METVFTVSLYDYHYLLGLLTDPEVQDILREDARKFQETVEVHIRDFGVVVLVDSMDERLREFRFGQDDSSHMGERLERLYDSIYRQTAGG